MASIRRKTGSQFWYACFSNPDGSRSQRSTETTDRKLALKLAEHFEETALKRKTEAQIRAVLFDIHQRIHGASLTGSNVKDFAVQWLSTKRGEVAASTFAAYQNALKSLLEFLGNSASESMDFVTVAQIAAWRDLVAARASATTANNRLKIIRTFFESAWRNSITSDNPAAKVAVLKSQPFSRRPFSKDELVRLLEIASPEWMGIILCGAYTGQRLKDIASLTWAQVDLARSEIRLTTRKTGRHQVIPIHPSLEKYLRSSSRDATPLSPLFPDAYRTATAGKDVSPLSQQFYALLVRAGLAVARPPKRVSAGIGRRAPRRQNSLTFHSLRHTATSWLKDAGVSESVARDIIGHESAEISRLYTHTGDKAKREAVLRLPELPSTGATQTDATSSAHLETRPSAA